VLVVDDDPVCVRVSVGLLEYLGYAPETAVSAEEALLQFDPERHAMVLTDNEMGSLSGIELARMVKRRSPATPVILCTGRPPEQASVLDAVLPKPLGLDALRGVLAQVSISAA
jgi:CheY-like chemotaxis protein